MSNTDILNNTEKINIDKELKSNAVYHIDECKVMKEKISKDKNPLIMAKVNGFEIGLCDCGKFMELLNNEIKQSELCLKGKPNKFSEFMFCT